MNLNNLKIAHSGQITFIKAFLVTIIENLPIFTSKNAKLTLDFR